MTELPDLSIEANGNSGIEIRIKPPKQYNLVEFTLRDDIPITAFISPWMQFEPAAMNEWRLKAAYEIVRRVTAYEKLIQQVKSLQAIEKSLYERLERRLNVLHYTQKMWATERATYGLPDDFSDIKTWPAAMYE